MAFWRQIHHVSAKKAKNMNQSSKKTAIAYAGIISVVFIWAIMPIFKKILIGGHVSASVYTAVTGFVSALALLVLNRKQLKSLNAGYFKVAIPTGLCLGAASLTQALAYNFNASPTNQAFLENLSCLIVPIILFIVNRKKPSMLTVSAAIICLLSSMVLSGVFGETASFAPADILNAIAGLLYGVNIAFTGIYAKKFMASLYVMIQLFVKSVLSLLMAIAFNYITVGASPIDPIVFTFDPWLILSLIAIGIISNSVCWTIRTSAMKYVSASVVAVIMPFSAVITGIIAVIGGQDSPSWSLLIGAVLGIAASLLSAYGDIREQKNDEQKNSELKVNVLKDGELKDNE